MAKPITPTSMHTLMEEIIKILYRHQANDMVHFYVNNKHYTTDERPDFIEILSRKTPTSTGKK